MTTDFSYGGKQIVSGGPFKPSGKDMPIDARTRVETYVDIASIPNPHVGMTITVLQDETNDNKMTEYKVKSLKADSYGTANTVIDEVVRYVDYLGVTSFATDLSLSGSSLQLKNSAGNLIGNAVTLPSGGSDMNPSDYYTKTEVDTKIGDINTILDNINGEVI